MTCFNPKYIQYEYGTKVPKKIEQKLIKQYHIDKDLNKLNKLKQENSVITKIINFQTKKNFDETKIGNGSMIIPCGKCLGCKLDKASEWATRAIIEMKQWKNACFITLTYNEENVPKVPGTNYLTLKKSDVQDFFKRLRKHYDGIEKRRWIYPNGKVTTEDYPIRYYYCGEYGERTKRPHYHIALFNWIPDDLKPLKGTENKYGDRYYTSEKLQNLWSIYNYKTKTYKPIGFILVGKMTYESASYIARYTLKKIYDGNEKYKDKGQQPEFVETSRKGGIGINGFLNKKEFKKIKENMTVLTKTAKGVKFKKIPQFIKNKWKEQNRLEYFEKTDKERIKSNEEAKKRMGDMEIKEYITKQKNLILAKIHNAKTTSRKAV